MLYDTATSPTADSWTSHNRAFIGMTCHWIGRISAANMAHCRGQDQGEATNVVTLQHGHSLMFTMSFGPGEQVVATTTDNGANYVAAFKYFGVVEICLWRKRRRSGPWRWGLASRANLHAQLGGGCSGCGLAARSTTVWCKNTP
ncbi:hypothetical protein GWK47_040377 [Chionoecetes opilio]|uniref:Uncharacterized protein n=1 Tax=Chionoecetes opilio TaxID=41210 RepID=A0A8J5CZX9_CHIOP|nr:hypothetical protein GWK47_040377 [Chionoecetes opilio]